MGDKIFTSKKDKANLRHVCFQKWTKSYLQRFGTYPTSEEKAAFRTGFNMGWKIHV